VIFSAYWSIQFFQYRGTHMTLRMELNIMPNKNTLKVRARRLRRAHDRKIAAIKLADDRVKLAASLDAMVTIVGSVDLVR
jgi:hypothetical protein